MSAPSPWRSQHGLAAVTAAGQAQVRRVILDLILLQSEVGMATGKNVCVVGGHRYEVVLFAADKNRAIDCLDSVEAAMSGNQR